MDVASLTRGIDGASARLPYLYFSWRCGMLGVTFVALAAWWATGFNIVEGAVPLIGIQYSTVATFCFFFWLLMANFQVGGFRSFSDIKKALFQDVLFLGRIVKHPKELLFFSKDRSTIESYPKDEVVDGMLAFIVSLLACMGALFAFESIWVPLYDYFQFGSVVWPVYYADVAGPPVAMRNMVLGIGSFLLIPFYFALMFDMSPTHMRKRFEVRWRFDSGFAWLSFVAFMLWLNWVTFPHKVVDVATLGSGQVIGPDAGSFSLASCYVWPTQHLFPQNTYTFYPCSLQGTSYTPPQILGFFNADPWVHLINVLTKFSTFAAICYPCMAWVKRAG